MLTRFHQFILDNNLIASSDKILVALSGGVDSMVLLDLCIKSKLNTAIAHCNFKLRGEESDKDAEFVFNYANKQGVALFITEFETTEIAKTQFISIEMAARELRYRWFEELCNENGFSKIAVGHHSDDSAETFMLNIARGTGISGMHGIRPMHGNIIRPLLPFSRKEIVEYAQINNIPYREDSSNQSVQIKRNLIRHEIIPRFERLNPAFRANMSRTIEIMYETEQIFKQKIEEEKIKCLVADNETVRISIAKLQALSPLRTYLFELIRPYGFDLSKVEQIIDALNGDAGKEFFSKSHRLVKDRTHLIIEPKRKIDTQQSFPITLDSYPDFIQLEIVEKRPDFKNSSQNIAYLDKSKLLFPLTMRRWQEGDFFYPLGMKNKKKLSDFFTDIKLSLIEKEHVWLLCSGNDIVWVVGYRLDERYKLSSNTNQIVAITYNQKIHI